MSSRRQRGPSLEESLATQRRLSRFDDRRSHVKLDLGHSTQRRLYGRDEEITTLLELQKRSMKKDDSGSSAMVVCFVHGLSGSGKTSLCEYLRDRTAGRSYFMSGKFDLQAKIYSAIIEAFENLANQIYENDDKEVMEDLRNHLSLECRMLAKLAPSFSKILGDQDDKKESGEEVASSSFLTFDRIGVTFRNFLQFFCKPDRPLIMFIDDLQWADSKSFAMIRTLLNDKEVHNCLFLGGYRDEDKVRVGLFRGELENTVTDVHVGPLGKESVNALVAGLLAQNEEATESLAALLQKKTLGNAFHVIQFMELLQHKGLLKYNFVGGKWEWDMDQISTQTDVSDNVADILASRIESLPPQVLRILQLAACLGFFVRGDLLEGLALSDLLADTSGDRGSASSDLLSRELFQEAILHAEEEGLLERDHTLVKFSHDRVQLTAYELLPEGKSREELHFRIGKAIHGLSNSNVLLAADQLNRGSPCIHSEVERISLIQLNLDAARVAQRQSAAELVADFLDKALSLSRAGDWSICYELILSVYTMSAEVEATRGRFEQSEELVGTILEHAKSPLDSMPARAVLAEVMAVVFRFEESATVARQALAICGEKLPPATKMGVWVELRKTRRLLRDKGDVELATLPYMKDPMKLAAMKILKLGEMYGFNLSKYLAGLCFLRMAQLTIKYGIDRATGGYAYACYGLHLATFTEDYAEAFRFSRIALKVKGDMASLPGISLVVNGSLTHLKLPSAVGLEQLLEAYRVGLETGQMMMGCICLTIYGMKDGQRVHGHIECFSFSQLILFRLPPTADAYRHNGLPLGPYADDLRQFGSQLKLCSEDYSSHYLLSNLQLALNLMVRVEQILPMSMFIQPNKCASSFCAGRIG
jgi:predicted ATPase